MTTRLTILLVLMIATVAFAGCGGGDDSGATAFQQPSKAEYIKQASRLCREERAGLSKEISTYLAQHQKSGKPAAVVYADMAHLVLLPTVENEINQMEEVPIPPGEEPAVEAMLDLQRLAVDQIAVRDKIPSITAIRRSFIEADYQYEAFGLLACANGPKRD